MKWTNGEISKWRGSLSVVGIVVIIRHGRHGNEQKRTNGNRASGIEVVAMGEAIISFTKMGGIHDVKIVLEY
jgi:hypothetical protein